MAVKSLGYDSPVYLARHTQTLAGSGEFSKFICFTNINLYSIGISLNSKIAQDSEVEFSLVREGNNSADSVVLATNTYGPFKIKGNAMTDKGGFVSFAANEKGPGGLAFNPGDKLSVTGAPGAVTLEYGVQPLSNVTV
jgi:hypothetical protein